MDTVSNNKKEFYTVFLWLLFILILSSIPLFGYGFGYGVDTRFHLNRIEGILNEVIAHHFPVRISGYFMHGYGYPTSVYYGDILLYFPAFLRLIGFSVTNAYKAYIWFVNILTVLISYGSFKKITGRNDAAILGCMAYSLSTVRLMDIYIRGAAGEYSAIAFLPLVAVGVWMIYDVGSSPAWMAPLVLAIGMSGVIETHIITTETVVIGLVIVILFLLKETLKWRVIKQYLLAVIFTILINLWFLVPFLDYFINENVLVTNGVAETEGIQFGGVYLYQYFMFFMYPYGSNTVDVHERLATIPGMLLTLGLILVIGLLVFRKKLNGSGIVVDSDSEEKSGFGIVKILVIVSLLILFISSNIFPWDFLSEHTGSAGKLLIQIQYPWRFITVACIFMTLVLIIGYGLIADKFKKVIIYASTLIAVVTVIIFTIQYYHEANVVYYEDDSSLWVDEVGAGEYLKVGNDKDSIVGMGNDILSEDVLLVEEVSHRGSDYQLHVVTGDADGYINMPVFNYKGYYVSDDSGNTYDITETDNGRITFVVPAESDKLITIGFREPWYWRMAEIVTVISVLAVVVMILRMCIGYISNRNKI